MKNKLYKSPSEINKFVYCNYAWYYEKTLGTKHINAVRKEKLEELGMIDSTHVNFARGYKYHHNYLRKNLLFKIIRAILFIVVVFLLLYFYHI